MTKSNAGRKTVMTDATIQKLEEAFKMGCSDLEACLNADISKSTLYSYIQENPKFSDRKEKLKETPTFRARKCLTMAIEKRPALALKYLERKKKKEFSPKTELAVTGLNLNDLFAGMEPELAKAVKDKLKGVLEEGEEENNE